MKIFKHFVVVACIGALLVSGCSNNFQVTGTWKDITVVYGLLNYSDTAQYIKINKAYLNPTTSALKIAQIPDSIYYPNLTVVLQQTDPNNNVTNIPLNEVDGNTQGYPKDYGTFAQSPNYLYKTTQTLSPNDSYELIITKPNGQQVTASTNVIGNLTVLSPSNREPLTMFPNPNSLYNINWVGAANAYFYGLTIRFHYIEYPNGSPGDSVQKYFDWPVFTADVPFNTSSGAIDQYPINTINLYLEMLDNIAPSNSLTRVTRGLDFNFAAGGNILYTYINVGIAQSGLTQGEIEPTYTNINGGVGVFSSRVFTSVTGVSLSGATMDSISCTSLTRGLNFLNAQELPCQ